MMMPGILILYLTQPSLVTYHGERRREKDRARDYGKNRRRNGERYNKPLGLIRIICRVSKIILLGDH